MERSRQTDDFGSRIIARRAGIDEESAHFRQEVKRIRQVVEQLRSGIATHSNRFRTVLDQGSVRVIRNGLRVAQGSNHHRTRFDDFSVEVIARSDPCKHYAGFDCCIEPP